jgi:NDP-sugar pyrophosphorylase family protein
VHPVAILAGGLGTRLRQVTGESVPKALAPVGGRPFIDRKLIELRDAGAQEVLLLVAHGADAIRDHVGNGSSFGLRVDYLEDGPTLLGTGGAVARAIPHLGDEFWVTYGDTLLDFDHAAAEAAFATADTLALMTVLRNQDRWQPSNALVRDGRVIAYAKQPAPAGAEHIDYGMILFHADAIRPGEDTVPFDLVVVLRRLVAERQLGAFEVDRRFHDIGTPAALQETEAWLGSRGRDD